MGEELAIIIANSPRELYSGGWEAGEALAVADNRNDFFVVEIDLKGALEISKYAMSSLFSDAVAHFQAGRYPEAIEIARRVITAEPLNPDGWQLIGLANCQLGKYVDGAEAIGRAVELRPLDAALANNFGEALRQAGRLEDSERALRAALQLQPRFAEACFNLGNTLRDRGLIAEALSFFQQAIAIRPNYPKAHLNLANLLRVEGRLPRAAEHYRVLLSLQSPSVDVLLAFSSLCSELQRHGEAAELLALARQKEPMNVAVLQALASQARVGGDELRARELCQRLADLQPDSFAAKLRVASILPEIPKSVEEIEFHRQRLLKELWEMRESSLPIDLTSLHTYGAEAPMAWAYQGLDVKPLRVAYASLFADRIRPLETRSGVGKPRMGVVVTPGHEGVYAECLGRLVLRLPSEELDVWVVCSQAGRNILHHLLGDVDGSVKYLPIPERIDLAAERIRDAELDLLHYWEIGTDSQNYFLPFLKPAAVQSTGWGWPVTSGIAQVDYFVSSELIEARTADDDYTESLVRLKTLPTWYAKPPIPSRFRARSECGLPVQGSIYLCTQNLKKFHPDFDWILGELLRRDLTGYVAVIEDSVPAISRQLSDRLKANLPELWNRILFLPRLPRGDYLHFVGNADVILDTLHYGGGANSLYDAFACGTPVVSLPGRFHRGRYAVGAYAKLRISGLIATTAVDYVEKALSLANNADYRSEVRKLILERCDILFSDDEAVSAHREFFLNAIHRVRQ